MPPITRSQSKKGRMLITNPSGYLGGSLLARWSSSELPYNKLYALVCTPEQAEAVKEYGAEPLHVDILDSAALEAAIILNNISIIYVLNDSFSAARWHLPMISALATVKTKTGQKVHFLNTISSRLFGPRLITLKCYWDQDIDSNISRHDTCPRGSDISWEWFEQALRANSDGIKNANEYGVNYYTFISSAVYGQGEGFGKKTSTQTMTIVNTALKLGRVYVPDCEDLLCSVCHISDNTALYIEILRNILSGNDIPHGSNGYYLASSGVVDWGDFYAALASSLTKRNLIETQTVELASLAVTRNMALAIGCPIKWVPMFLAGSCLFTAKSGLDIGWKPQYPAEHILEMVDSEVENILQNA